jgi:hypothetical protein
MEPGQNAKLQLKVVNRKLDQFHTHALFNSKLRDPKKRKERLCVSQNSRSSKIARRLSNQSTTIVKIASVIKTINTGALFECEFGKAFSSESSDSGLELFHHFDGGGSVRCRTYRFFFEDLHVCVIAHIIR